ncbi:MAG: hypothetical protein AABX54_02760 [Nanoarchaeota archaeon]
MENCCTPTCKAIKLIVLAVIIILISVYKPAWNLWLIIGVLLIIKAIMLFIMPVCPCSKTKTESVVKKKR